MGSKTIGTAKQIIFLFFMIRGTLQSAEPFKEVEYVQYAKEIMNPFIDECEKNFQLDCIGTGGRFSRNVAGIDITFIAYRKGSIEEARKLEVTITEKLLAEVNGNEKIRPFLSEYPFKADNIGISLSFRKEDDSRYLDNSVALVCIGKGQLIYSAENPKTHLLDTILEEPYEDAKKIVNLSK